MDAPAEPPPCESPSRRARKGRYWESPAHGLHVPSGSIDDARDLCRALVAVLPDGAVFTHLTGAAARGWSLPEGVDPPIIASAGAPAPHLDRRGVYVRRCRLDSHDVEDHAGVPVASAAQIARELAEDLSLVDLVVALDSALHLGDLEADALAHIPRPRRRGRAVLLHALDLVDERAESAYETVLRLVHVLSGLHDVVPQHPLTNSWGQPIARADLWLRGTRRLHEYDGADHRGAARQRRDRARDNDLARNRYDRRGYTRPDITEHCGRIVRDAEDAFGLPPEPGRVQGWLREFRLSSYSPPGRRLLERRLARFRRGVPPRTPNRVAQE